MCPPEKIVAVWIGPPYIKIIIKISTKIIKGDVDDDLNFSYGEETEVDLSCGFTLNDEFWVAGGDYQSSFAARDGKVQQVRLMIRPFIKH